MVGFVAHRGCIHRKALMCLFLRMRLWNVQSTPPLRRRRGYRKGWCHLPMLDPTLCFDGNQEKQAYATINDTYHLNVCSGISGRGAVKTMKRLILIGDLVGHKTKKQHKSKRLTLDDCCILFL